MIFHPFAIVAFLFLLVPVAVVVAVVWGLTRPKHVFMPPAPTAPPGETALEILARRFASGEITADEYQKARDLLQGDKPPAG